MPIKNAQNAVVPPAKLLGYCLNPNHEPGRHKARMFRAALGIDATNWLVLRDALLEAVQSQEPEDVSRNDYGLLFRVDFEMATHAGTARVRSSWIVRDHEGFPSLTSCYPI